jgi:hypothetical protein
VTLLCGICQELISGYAPNAKVIHAESVEVRNDFVLDQFPVNSPVSRAIDDQCDQHAGDDKTRVQIVVI